MRVPLPRRSVRLRLTLIYAGLFLASGAVLLAITYVLVLHATDDVLVATRADGSSFVMKARRPSASAVGKRAALFEASTDPPSQDLTRLTPQQLGAQVERDLALAERQHEDEMRQLLEQSGIALSIMAALSIGLGWLAAGRVLRPLRTLNDHAREISATSLHKRLALHGPDDELKQLGDTFDDLLGRLEASFTAQRQFVANASHELRTPLARAQTIAEVALGDPEATVDSLRTSHLRVLAAGRQQERLIEALLTLARSERGLERRQPVDVSRLTQRLLTARRSEAERRRISVHARLEAATTSGETHLVERLVANLLDNALRHNLAAGGRIDVTTASRDGHTLLRVVNTGPSIPPDEVDRLFRPFQRLAGERTEHGDGVGLGLSIVKAIATAHGAAVEAVPGPEGGLEIEVAFPAAAGDPEAIDVPDQATARPGRISLPGLRRRLVSTGGLSGSASG